MTVKFHNLSAEEYQKLLQFPAYISLLAANVDGYLDDAEKKAAVTLSHIVTFSGDPSLKAFFRDVEMDFEKNITDLDSQLPFEKAQRELIIKNELRKLQKLVLLLDKNHAKALYRSMRLFKEHVSKAHHNILVDFIFPTTIEGLNPT